MELEKILNNAFEAKLIKENSWQIKTSAFFPNGVPIYIFLDKTSNGYIISDKKQTLKYMSNIYDLASPDIKTCINGILKVNRLRIVENIIASNLLDESRIVVQIFDLIMCIGQLVNMLVFFEEPSKHK